MHSEVGRLRKVLVCAPGLAHRRLTPSNSDDLLFDDVMWVQAARRDHFDFVNKMQDRGVDVVELHDVLARTMANPVARDWLLDRTIYPSPLPAARRRVQHLSISGKSLTAHVTVLVSRHRGPRTAGGHELQRTSPGLLDGNPPHGGVPRVRTWP